MHLAYPLPWWLAIVLAAAVAAVAFLEYRRPLAPLSPARRAILVAFRVIVLGALVLFLFRPIAVLPPSASRDAIVPILVDVSRSMRLADADGQARLARAVALLRGDLLPALSKQFRRVGLVSLGGRSEKVARRCSPWASDRPTARAIVKWSGSPPVIHGWIRHQSICM